MTGKIIIYHHRLREWGPIFSILLVSEIIFFTTKYFKVQLHGPILSIDWGVIKDLVDVISVMIFPWHGWVFGIALLASYFFSPNILRLIVLLFLSSVLTSVISTCFNFGEPSAENFVKGWFTYLVINSFVFTLVHLIWTLIKWGSKCLR